MTAVLEREDTVSINLYDTVHPRNVATFNCLSSNNTNDWQYGGGGTSAPSQPWVSPGTVYIGGGRTSQPFGPRTSPPFAPVPQSPFHGLEELGRVKDYTVPTHNYEPHCDILGNPVGCKHCSYANVHKLDPASHPFTIYEEA